MLTFAGKVSSLKSEALSINEQFKELSAQIVNLCGTSKVLAVEKRQ